MPGTDDDADPIRPDAAAPATMPEASRVGIVAEWFVAGMRPSQVPGQAEKAGWAIGAVELGDLIDHAYRLIRADARVVAELERAKSIARYNAMYARSLAIQDFKACLAVQKQLDVAIARAEVAASMEEPDDGPAPPSHGD